MENEMKDSRWKAFTFITVLILAISPAFAQQTATPAMSVCQARRTIVEELQRVQTTEHPCLKSTPSRIAFTVRELKFQAEPTAYKSLLPPGDYAVDLNTLGEVTIKFDRYFYGPLIDGNDPRYGNAKLKSEREVKENLSTAILGFLTWMPEGGNASGEAQAFANAMNRMRLYARTFDPSQGFAPACFADKDEQARIWAEFQKRASAWRALSARPRLSEAVRGQQLLAENAVNMKNFEAAAAAYDAGTQIDPMWPEGHFNAAAIYGELKDYDDAVWHMRCYLELMPNAPDAQNARDQMLLWQAEAEQQAATQ
jgi:hypothetical protein